MVISETYAEAAPTYAFHKTSKKAEGECSFSNILLLLSAYGWLLKVIGSIKMSLLGKVETEVEAKVPAAKFHKLFSCKAPRCGQYEPSKCSVSSAGDIFMLRMFTSHTLWPSYHVVSVSFISYFNRRILKTTMKKKMIYIIN